jgi:hypothetical protein
MAGNLDDGRCDQRKPLKPSLRMRKTYLGCVLVRQLDGTVKVWAPVWGGNGPPQWELLKVSSSMKSAHNFVHNTRSRKA